jgi:hypothetical protein
MPATLDFRQESLGYTGTFERPALELWGAGGNVIGRLHEALAPYKVGLQNFHLSPTLPTAADPMLTVNVGTTVLKFSFEKIDVAFTNFTEEELQGIPTFLDLTTNWLTKAVPSFAFSSHQVQYYSHSFLKESPVEDYLRLRSQKGSSLPGFDLGTGVIQHRSIPERKWVTQLIVDRSQLIPGALFISLFIRIESGKLEYGALLAEGRKFFETAVGELGLVVPPSS